jgi:signal transduction histidine kinase
MANSLSTVPLAAAPRDHVSRMASGGEHQLSSRYLMRTVRIGVQSTAMLLACLVVFPFLPGHRPISIGPYVAISSAAALGGVVVAFAPWRRLFDRGLEFWALYGWSAFDIGLISGGVAATGAGRSGLWFVYALTTAFFAASYPLRGQLALLAATVGAYLLTLGLLHWHVTAAALFLRVAILCVLMFLSSFLSRELRREASALEVARAESERVTGLLTRLLARVVRGQEEERVRVGHELHDELGQLLTSILQFARRLEHDLSGDDAERALRIEQIAQRALAGTRELARTLRPVELDHLGLASAVRRLAYDIEDRHGMHVVVRAQGLEDRLPSELETAAYRIVQEALTNVVRHAGARDVVIELVRRRDDFTAIVQDDGRGFDPSRPGGRTGDGLGLVGMLERARLVGGEVRIESAPGAGTVVRMRAPMPR